jgi:hypothetical protein
MTSKIYRSAQGVAVDLGVLMLQNEHVRAVGNMKVNARGDKIDNQNQVVETKPQQIQRQNARSTTNVSDQPVHSSAAKAQRNIQADNEPVLDVNSDPEMLEDLAVEPAPTVPTNNVLVSSPVAPAADPVINTPVAPAPGRVIDRFKPKQQTASAPAEAPVAPAVQDSVEQPKKVGLAGAIARTREIKQELDRTRRQQQQDQGVRKI